MLKHGREILVAAASLHLLATAGCVNIPVDRAGNEPRRDRLVSHVQFLAQPALKGRKSGTHGARLARQYIESRFEACGLIPWANEKEYGQSFVYGKNIVGVLPGTDPALSKEIILLSAHYDHEGKRKGKIYPGAADNAAGVAVLLEAAKELSRQRPQRTVAFAAFDAEERMMLGSFAFTCRPDATNAPIAAVVNVDMLGRDFLDVISNTVFVAGAEGYPDLRREISSLGTNAGLRVLPIGSDLVGPRSDHVAFEYRAIPCLFLSCGTFRDYHQPTDTPDKLDYTAIDRSAALVVETVRALAGGDRRKGMEDPAFNLEELQTVSAVLSETADGYEQAGIKKDDVVMFRKLEATAREHLANGQYNRDLREKLALDASSLLAPYTFLPGGSGALSDEQRQDTIRMTQLLQNYSFNYRKQVLDGYRQLVAQLQKYRPGAFRSMPKIQYECYDIADANVKLSDRGDGRQQLNVLILQMNLAAEVKRRLGPIHSFGGGLSFNVATSDCEGTREQIADFCLLQLRADRSNALHFEQKRKVLRRVTETESKGSYEELLAERLARGGFKDETEWIANCILSRSPDLAGAGMSAVGNGIDPRIRQALCSVVRDRSVRPDVRAGAIGVALKRPDKSALLAACEMLDDPGPVSKREYLSWFRSDYPFTQHPAAKFLQPMVENYFAKSPEAKKTVGMVASEQLKKASGKDFGTNQDEWRRWIEKRFGKDL